MNKLGLRVIIALGIMALAVYASAEEKPWIDLENCDFCKCLTNDPHLLENMSWEYHDIDNGLLSITTVAPEAKDSYLKAQKEMEKLAMEMSTGQATIEMCENCSFYGKMMMAGVNFEMVETGVGYIMLLTSDKPETLKMIQEFGNRNREYLAEIGKTD